MEKKRETQIISLITIVIAVLCTTIAFASLSSTLQIGTVDTNVTVNGKWEIVFNSVTTSTTGQVEIAIPPIININDNTKINDYSASFNDPGDSLTVNFSVKNNGTIDAKLAEIIMEDELTCHSLADTPSLNDANKVCHEITYVLTDTEGVPISINDTLAAGATRTMQLTLTYVSNVSAFDETNLPEGRVSITGLGLSLKYIQA